MNKAKEVLLGVSQKITLLPAPSQVEIDEFQKKLPGPLPAEIQELISYSAGFDFHLGLRRTPVGSVRFAGEELGFPGDALPCPISVLGDGYGNYWVVDVNPNSGKWGTVFFICHDPPALVVQAAGLAAFLSQIIDLTVGRNRNTLEFVRSEAVSRIWKENPWLRPIGDVLSQSDAKISNFAKTLPNNFRLADLRPMEIGSGFTWGLSRQNSQVRRDGADLLFAVEQKAPSFLKRVLTHTR